MGGTREAYSSPGVYLQKIGPERRDIFRTGVPAFLGFPGSVSRPTGINPFEPRLLTRWPEFEAQFGEPWVVERVGQRTLNASYLWYVVRGFFQNGGEHCYIVPLAAPNLQSLQRALDSIAPLIDIDLICFPDLFSEALQLDIWSGHSDVMTVEGVTPPQIAHVQQLMVDHCKKVGGRMAILDTARSYRPQEAVELWQQIDLSEGAIDGAIYYPWIEVRSRKSDTLVAIPPSGHVAGVITRTDKERGVHKAPANEVVSGVVNLDKHVTSAEQDFLNPRGINCIRSFPGRGIRIWGARTLSGQVDWQYVNVRRVFLTAIRWIKTYFRNVAFEPNDAELQRRVERELTAYFNGQFRRGALKGASAEEAFYVKCNAETNPPESRAQGRLVTEIGLAMSAPLEFIVVRLIYGTTGVQIEGPVAATQRT